MAEDNQDITFRKAIDKHVKDNPHLFIEQAFKDTCRNKSLSDAELKVLKDELGKDIVVQVEKADRRKPILLVGSNDALVKGTLALIWNTHPLIPKGKPLLGSGNDRVYFVDKNCSGMTEDEIRKDLFHSPVKRPVENDLAEVMHQRTLFKRKMSECLKPLMNLYNNLCILSLRGLEREQHGNILKRIIAEVEERKGNNEEGCLIVSIGGINTLPQEISRQFDPIYLEPEKQVETTSKKIPRRQKQPYVDKNEFNIFMKNIIKENPKSSCLQTAKKANSMMKKENRFLDDNGNPPYAEATLKNKIHKLKKGLKRTISSFSKLKNDGKMTVKKRHLKSDVKS